MCVWEYMNIEYVNYKFVKIQVSDFIYYIWKMWTGGKS